MNGKNVVRRLDDWSLIIFLIALIVLISMWDVHIFLPDEKPLVNQLFNLEHGSFSLDKIKVPLDGAWYFEKEGIKYSVYSHAVPVFSLPVFLILWVISNFMNIGLFFILFWSVLIIILGQLLARKFNEKNIVHLCILISLTFFAINLYLYKPIFFEAWGELISMQFFNIIITSAAVVLVYQLIKAVFTERAGLFAAMLFLFATPYSFWGVGVKEHALAMLLALACFSLFYEYIISRDSKPMYIAYCLSGIAAWMRIFDALPLFIALFFMDIVFVRGFFKGSLKEFNFKHVRSFLSYSLKIFAIMVISLFPYFINNFLVIGNPFFFMGVGPREEISIKAPEKITDIAKGLSETSDFSINILHTLKEIPGFLSQYWSMIGFDALLNSIFRIFYYSDISMKLSIFQENPLLSIIFPLALLFVLRKILAKNIQKISINITKQIQTMDIFFLLYTILFFAFYVPFQYRYSDGYSYDYRYFMILFIPLIYYIIRAFSIEFPSYIENNLSSIMGLFFIGTYLTFLMAIPVLYLFFPPNFLNVIFLIKFLNSISIILIIAFFLVYLFNRKINYLKYIISICLSLSFFWVFMANFLGRGDVFDRGVSMMLPIFEYIHEFLRLLLTTQLLR